MFYFDGLRSGATLRWQSGRFADGVLRSEADSIDLSRLDAFFARLAVERAGPALSEEERYLQSEEAAVWQALLATLPCRVVNRLSPGASPRRPRFGAEERRAARQAGIRVPPTVVTTRCEDAVDFFASASRNALAGVPSGGSPSRLLEGESGVEEIARLVSTGVIQMTAVPAGTRLSAFVCGDRAALARDSAGGEQDLDEPATLRLADRCIALGRALGLGFVEISLVEDGDGNPWCLAADGMPSLDGASERLQRRVVDDLTSLLAAAPGERAR